MSTPQEPERKSGSPMDVDENATPSDELEMMDTHPEKPQGAERSEDLKSRYKNRERESVQVRHSLRPKSIIHFRIH